MEISFEGHRCHYEIRHLVGMFFPGKTITLVDGQLDPKAAETIQTIANQIDGLWVLRVKVNLPGYHEEKQATVPNDGRYLKQAMEETFGHLLFALLTVATGVTPKWGILTGIRPAKKVADLLEAGKTEGEIEAIFSTKYLVNPDKTKLLFSTVNNQKRAISLLKPQGFHLYIGIPFCPTRCLYCSFVSHSIEKTAKMIPEYVELLCREIEYTGKMAREKGMILQTIYMGGGTPTTLSPAQLTRVFRAVAAAFDLSHLLEYTVEAGRADTITREKLAAILKAGIGRISINPQTFSDSVLQAVGRNHTAKDVVDCYKMARDMGFREINMDLIAGLHTDTLASFQHTVDLALALAPENITIHTLSVKRSSDMVSEKKEIYDVTSGLVSAMLDYAYPALAGQGYAPYYLYRQKNMRENLENVGFTKPGKESLYNIYIMEELASILACGAGGVSKIVDPTTGDMERFFNYKFPYEYIGQFATILDRKTQAFSQVDEKAWGR